VIDFAVRVRGGQGVENLIPASSGVEETNCLQGRRNLPLQTFLTTVKPLYNGPRRDKVYWPLWSGSH